jgi:hypothetical protein
MIEGSGAGSGSIPLTSGSGSGRPKNMWIRIRNTCVFCPVLYSGMEKVYADWGNPNFLEIADTIPSDSWALL